MPKALPTGSPHRRDRPSRSTRLQAITSTCRRCASISCAEVRPAILTLMVSVIFPLLMACANVGNLPGARLAASAGILSARSPRGKLLAARLSDPHGSGAALRPRWARWPVQALRGWNPRLASTCPANLPRLEDVHIDGTVLAYSALAGLARGHLWHCSRLAGFAPRAHECAARVQPHLRNGQWSLLRNAVVMSEVALSFVLLIGSGLMFRSFLKLQQIDPGF